MVQSAVCQVMAGVVLDSEGRLLVQLLRGATISSQQYVRALKRAKLI
jgi:hypothetical protein